MKYYFRKRPKSKKNYSVFFHVRKKIIKECKISGTCHDEISDLPDDVDDQGVDDVRLEAHVPIPELKVVIHNLPSEKVC